MIDRQKREQKEKQTTKKNQKNPNMVSDGLYVILIDKIIWWLFRIFQTPQFCSEIIWPLSYQYLSKK